MKNFKWTKQWQEDFVPTIGFEILFAAFMCNHEPFHNKWEMFHGDGGREVSGGVNRWQRALQFRDKKTKMMKHACLDTLQVQFMMLFH
jgi:hypothetical protein